MISPKNFNAEEEKPLKAKKTKIAPKKKILPEEPVAVRKPLKKKLKKTNQVAPGVAVGGFRGDSPGRAPRPKRAIREEKLTFPGEEPSSSEPEPTTTRALMTDRQSGGNKSPSKDQTLHSSSSTSSQETFKRDSLNQFRPPITTDNSMADAWNFLNPLNDPALQNLDFNFSESMLAELKVNPLLLNPPITNFATGEIQGYREAQPRLDQLRTQNQKKCLERMQSRPEIDLEEVLRNKGKNLYTSVDPYSKKELKRTDTEFLEAIRGNLGLGLGKRTPVFGGSKKGQRVRNRMEADE